MGATKQKSAGGNHATQFQAPILPTKWPSSLPNDEEEVFFSVLCSVSSIVWVVHGGIKKKYSPLYMWRTSQIDENDLKKDKPLSVLCRYLTKEAQDIVFGESVGGGDEKLAALNQSRLRKIPVLSMYVLSMNQTQAERISYMCSHFPSRVYQMKHDDFFSGTGGQGTLAVNQLATLRGVESMIGFPALVVDSGCFLTYTAADAEGSIIGGGMALGVEGRIEMVARRTQFTDGLTDLDSQRLLIKMADMVNAKKKIDPFAKDMEEAVLAELLQGIIFPYREVIKDYLRRTGLGIDPNDQSGEASTQEVPTVVVTGGSSSILQKLLEPSHGGLVQPDSTIPPYKVESLRHAVAYGVAFVLKQKAGSHKARPEHEYDSILLGRRVAKKASKPEEDGETISRGTISESVYGEKTESLAYVVRYDDNRTEKFTLLELHRGLKLYCVAGEKLRSERPGEALRKMLAKKIQDAGLAAAQLESINPACKNAAKKNESDAHEAVTAVKGAVASKSFGGSVVPPSDLPAQASTGLKKHNAAAIASPKPTSRKKAKKGKLPTDYIGIRIAKNFGDDGLYFGKITGYDDDGDGGGFWKVLYEDGDEEEFDKTDLNRALELYKINSELDENK